MPALADTCRMPLETAAAVYEANGANDDFVRATFRRDSALPLSPSNPTFAYREAAEALMFTGFAALRFTNSLEETLTAATDRVRRTELPAVPRACLDALAVVYTTLAHPGWSLDTPLPLGLVHALEDQCETYGVISAEERTTCHHGRHAAECCA